MPATVDSLRTVAWVVPICSTPLMIFRPASRNCAMSIAVGLSKTTHNIPARRKMAAPTGSLQSKRSVTASAGGPEGAGDWTLT